MSSHVFEIVELSNGEFALKRPESNDEPLVVIRFSKEAAGFLKANRGEVAKTMIEAGIEHAEYIASDQKSEWSGEDEQDRTIH